MYEKIPEALKAQAAFCLWKYEERNGKMTKVPYSLNGAKANPADKSTFANYRLVTAKLNGYDGIGMGVFGEFCAVDIDHCVYGDKVDEIAQDIISTMNSYTETSPSGTGIRIIFKADGFYYDRGRYYINNQKKGLEVYVAGATKKFVTLTGNALNEMGVEERSAEIAQVLEKYMVRPQKIASTPEVKAPGSYLSDESVVSKAQHSKQGEKFQALWDGSTAGHNSASEADMALANILAFWCGGDLEQMDRLFRVSGLMRDKWDRPQSGSTYGKLTLEKAVLQAKEFYKPIPKTCPKDDFDIIAERLEELNPVCNNRYQWNDLGSGRLFADIYRDIARYVPERKGWYVYDGKRWVQDLESLLTMELCKDLADKLLTYTTTIKDERLRNDYLDYVKRWQKRNYRNTILGDAQSVYPIPMKRFDNDRYLFNCKNGTLDLRTMEFMEHKPDDLITKISMVDYQPSATCERFNTFVDEIMSGDTEKAKFLQKILGYSVSGETRFECMYILYGETARNGKGTIMESILRVMGDYGLSVRPETIALKNTVNSQGPSEDIARLAGVRFANISEPDRGLVLNSAQVKSMVGNDSLNARRLHENSFDFRPQFKLYINCNHLPLITDNTMFASDRVVVIPFDKHFDELERDTRLKNKFAEPEVQSAILNWLIEGYKLIQAEGLTKPSSVTNAICDYQQDSDKVSQFFDECVVEHKDYEQRTSNLYTAYRYWCNDNGFYAENNRNFLHELKRKYIVKRKRPNKGGEKTTLLIDYRLRDEVVPL